MFDGTKIGPYNEQDPLAPISVYGRSKAAGESQAGSAATIVRTSWLCGEFGSNMVKTILGLLTEDAPLRFVDDQIGHPTFTADLAPVVCELAVQRRPGIFHVTNQGAVTWFEFARAVATAAGADPLRVTPCATADLRPVRPAPRPANSVLDNAALRLAGFAQTRDFREPLTELICRLREKGIVRGQVRRLSSSTPLAIVKKLSQTIRSTDPSKTPMSNSRPMSGAESCKERFTESESSGEEPDCYGQSTSDREGDCLSWAD